MDIKEQVLDAHYINYKISLKDHRKTRLIDRNKKRQQERQRSYKD